MPRTDVDPVHLTWTVPSEVPPTTDRPAGGVCAPARLNSPRHRRTLRQRRGSSTYGGRLDYKRLGSSVPKEGLLQRIHK